MNSMSKKYYNNCEKNSYEREEEKCPTIIKCGCPQSVTLPPISADILNGDVTLASLTLDTSCICDPVIKLDFTSVFATLLDITIGGISVQIYKQCKGQVTPTPVGPSWPVTGEIAAGVLAAPSYVSFFVCDSDSCEGECCTYTAVANVSGGVSVGLAAGFTNSTLSATVTCRSNQCQRKCKK